MLKKKRISITHKNFPRSQPVFYPIYNLSELKYVHIFLQSIPSLQTNNHSVETADSFLSVLSAYSSSFPFTVFPFRSFFLLYTNTHTFFFWEFCISSMKWKHVAHFVFSDFLVEENGYKKILFSPNTNWIDVELFLFLPMINWDNFVLDDDDKYQTIHYSRSSSLKIKNSSTLRGALLTDSGKHWWTEVCFVGFVSK